MPGISALISLVELLSVYLVIFLSFSFYGFLFQVVSVIFVTYCLGVVLRLRGLSHEPYQVSY